MPDSRTFAWQRWLPTLAAAAALLLSVGLVRGGLIAMSCGWLAQVAWAMALRPREPGHAPTAHRSDILHLAFAWGLALAGLALLLWWPLSRLWQQPALGNVIGTSLAGGIAILLSWRYAPMWQALQRGIATWRERQHHNGLHDWRALVLAGIVSAILLSVLALAWPRIGMSMPMRWALVATCAVLWPALHWVTQRLQLSAMFDVDDDAAALPTMPLDNAEVVPIAHWREHTASGSTPTPAAPVTAAATSATSTTTTPPPPKPIYDRVATRALFEAVRNGRVDEALQLLATGADPQALPAPDDKDQRSLAVLAAVLPDLRLLRDLIVRGVSVNDAHAGLTPLLAATRDSWHGRPEAVMTLLANGADPRQVDADGNTPLHHAARSSDPGVAALLRDAAADLDALNHERVTPVGMACASGNWRLARFLLERGARAQVDGATPALLAAAGSEDDDPVGVQLLLKFKAQVDARDAQGRSALHQAATDGHVAIIETLLEADADVHAHDARQRTPLLEAAAHARIDAIDVLAEAGADARALDAERRGALILACRSEHGAPSVALIEKLIALGADPAQSDASGKRAVDYAASAGYWSVVRALDPAYPLPSRIHDAPADAEPVQRSPQSLIRDGLIADDFDGIEPLLALLTPVERDALLREPEAASTPHRITWLLAHGADPEVRTGDADSLMFEWLSRGPKAWPVLEACLQRGASASGRGGLARFLHACQQDASTVSSTPATERMALDLLERGVDPFGASPKGDPSLTLALRLGWAALVQRLLEIGVDLETRDSHGMTALHVATALGNDKAVRNLVQRGASPELRAADGQTALGIALAAGRRDLATWLDWQGWRLPGRALRATDLPAAAIVGDAGAVQRLIDLGFPINTVDTQGCTALLRAAGGGHRSVVDALLQRGADPQRAAHTGATPLSAAVSMRQGEIVDQLLSAGATLEQRLPGEVTVLMLAAALGLPDLCARLLNAGANVQASDAQGLSPLHCATLYAFTARDKPRVLALIDTLLLAGADPDAKAGNGSTPLVLLLGARADPGTSCDEDLILAALERLLGEDVSLKARDPRGFGPLHLAALHGLRRTAQRLLRAGADPDARDSLNRTPREVAIMRGFVDVAAELEQGTSQVSMARFLREPGS